MRAGWLAVLIGCACAQAVCPHLGWAFTLNGSSNLHGWDTDRLTVLVNPTGCTISADRLHSIIDTALSAWNGVSTSSITLVRGGDVTTSPAEAKDGQSAHPPLLSPLILCDPNLSTTIGSPESPQDTNSIPAVTASRATALQMDYAYILLNAESDKSANIANLDDTELSIVIAHEMGHVLGLGHAQYSIPLMYYDATGKKNLQLAQDDIDGITFLYPRHEVGRNGIFGCSTLNAVRPGDKGTGGGSPTGAVAIIAAAALATWIFRRRAHITQA